MSAAEGIELRVLRSERAQSFDSATVNFFFLFFFFNIHHIQNRKTQLFCLNDEVVAVKLEI